MFQALSFPIFAKWNSIASCKIKKHWKRHWLHQVQEPKHADTYELNYNGSLWLHGTKSNPHFNSNLKLMTEEFVNYIIMKALEKVSEFDRLPVNLFLQCLDFVLLHIPCVINHTLNNCRVDPCFKETTVRPLLKKKNLNSNELKNYQTHVYQTINWPIKQSPAQRSLFWSEIQPL